MSEPSLEAMSKLSKATEYSIDWLVTGLGPENDNDNDFIEIPRYDAILAAGDGSFNDRSTILDTIPFTREFLRKKLGRGDVDGLIMLEARGDSMEPTIGDGDLVMVDTHDKDISGSIMAYVQGETAYIKRIQSFHGGVDIISDNQRVYPAHKIEGEDMNDLQLIGRVRWIGRLL